MYVYTADMCRYSYLASTLMKRFHHVLMTGDPGVGKTMISEALMANLPEGRFSMTINFSAQTSSNSLQVQIQICHFCVASSSRPSVSLIASTAQLLGSCINSPTSAISYESVTMSFLFCRTPLKDDWRRGAKECLLQWVANDLLHSLMTSTCHRSLSLASFLLWSS
jgi:hypothetical protein